MAGAATAYSLARRGCGEVVLLEKEILPGMHSSGRNAAMIRQNVPEELNCRLAVESMRFFTGPPADFPLPIGFQRTGSIILASGPGLEEMRRASAMQRRVGVEIRFLTPKETLAIVPELDPRSFEGAFHCPSDGTLDIHSLLHGYLKAAASEGASVRTGVEVRSIRVRNGRAVGVLTDQGEVEAETVVNAAGPWAAELARPAGLEAPIRPCRRHLVVTAPLPWVRRDWPFTWDLSGGFYFRPESGGLLMSPCDEEELPPCNAPVDPGRVAETAEKAVRSLPRAESACAAYVWAGLRNLTPDHLFIVGEDSNLPGFFWVAGLGGHGISASPALGAAAADLMLEGRTEVLDAAALSPKRFPRGTIHSKNRSVPSGAREALL